MKPRGRLALAAVVAAAVGLRLCLASQHDFTWDEAATYYISRLSWRQILLAMLSDRHPPLHYWLVHPISGWTHAELWLRLPSVAFAAASCLLVHGLARMLTRRNDVALGSAALYAAFYAFWELDTQVRMFSLAAAASLAATWLLARILLDGERRPRLFLGYAAALLVALWSLYLSAFVLAGHLLAIAVLAPRDRRIQGAVAAVFVGCVPLAGLVVAQLGQGNTEAFDVHLLAFHLATLYPYFLGMVSGLQAFLHLDPTRPALVGTFWAATAGMCAWHAVTLRRLIREDARRGAFLGAVAGGQLAFLLLAAAGGRLFNLRERYCFLWFPYLAMVTALALASLRRRPLRSLLYAALLGLNLGLWVDHNVDPYLWEGNMGPLAAVVRHDASSRDAIVLYLQSALFCQFNYEYAPEIQCLVEYRGSIRDAEPVSAAYQSGGRAPEYIIRSAAALRRDFGALSRRRNLWLLICTLSRPGMNEQAAVRGFLGRHCQVLESYSTTTAYYLYGEESLQLIRLRPRFIAGRPEKPPRSGSRPPR